MTHFDRTTTGSTIHQSPGFGGHRQSKHVATALPGGATSLPQEWQTQGFASRNGRHQQGAPVRSFADVVLDPLRWVVASKPHMIATAIAAATVAVFLLWF